MLGFGLSLAGIEMILDDVTFLCIDRNSTGVCWIASTGNLEAILFVCAKFMKS